MNMDFYGQEKFEQISHKTQNQRYLLERLNCMGSFFNLNRVKGFFNKQIVSVKLLLLNLVYYCFAILKSNKLHDQMEFCLEAILLRLRSCKHFHTHQVDLPISSIK